MRKKALTLPFDGPVQAVAYIRCSSDKQANKEQSLPAQRAEIERRAQQDGATIVRWWQDDGISGKNMEDRPGVNECLDWIAANRGTVQRLYCYDGKRLARNKAEMFAIRKDLQTSKVQLICIAQPSTDDAAANAIIESVWDGIAEAERIQLAKVVRRGQREALVQGFWPYPRPVYGYRTLGIANARGSTRYKLVVDEAKAAVVRRVFDLYLNGYGYKLLAAQLDKEGIPAPDRSDRPKTRVEGWTGKHIGAMINQVLYTGVALWEDEVVNATHHPAIVTQETFDKAQAVAVARCRNPGELGSINTVRDAGIFRPWLRCGLCGGTMTLNRGGQPSNRIWYYTCRTRQEKKSVCDGLTVKVDELDGVLLKVIAQEVLTEENIAHVVRDTLDQMKGGANKELSDRRLTIEGRIVELSMRLQRIAGKVADGSMDLEDVNALTTPLRKQREQYRAELAELPEPEPIPEIDPEAFRRAVLERWNDRDIKVQRKALDRILTEIRLVPEKASIFYSWKVEPSGYTYQAPFGPPEGSGLINRGWVLCGEVSRPKVYVTAAL